MSAKGFARPARTEMSIKSALEWAFGREHAHLDFCEEKGDNARPGVSTIYTIMMRGVLGCSVDGGGHSLPATDADIIASAVAALPVAHGGRGMAAQVARLAAAYAVPDWMPDATPRFQPVEWRMTKHGPFAQTELADGVTWKINGVDRSIAELQKQYKDPKMFRFCPVRLTPSADQIGKARREYLGWWGALLHLQGELRALKALDRITITREMPPMTPWRPASQDVDEAA